MTFKDFFQRYDKTKKRLFGGLSLGNGQSIFPVAESSGMLVSTDAAFKLTAFNAGVRIIAENIASLPKYVKKNTSKGYVDDSNNPIYSVINIKPNAYTNVFNFWKCIVTWIKGWGNAYAIIKRDKEGNVIELYQVHPSCVNVKMINGKKWYRVLQSDPNLAFQNNIYKDENILHFFELSFNGIVGVNPVEYNAISLGKSLATEKFAGEFYKKGGNLKAVLESDGSMGDDQYEKFMRHFNASKDFETPLLEYGIKYKQLAVSPIATQLISSEVLSIEDICRILNIPPHMLAELSHATFSNIEHQTIQFVQYSLRPIVKSIEEELESKLINSQRDKVEIKFSLDGLLRGDTSARSAYYHNAILDGYMSRNEVRELEGLEYKDGLDDMLYPLNTGVVGKTENQE